MVFFFKQKTAYEIVDCDWSSDVCSSDLLVKNEQDGVSNGCPIPFVLHQRRKAKILCWRD